MSTLIGTGLVAAVIAVGSALCQAQDRSSPAAPPPAPPGGSSEPAQKLEPRELIAALRRGGLILYLRHAATDLSQNDAKSRGPTDCVNQRNLIERGRADARAIGVALKTVRVPVGKVLASPTCRTVETAMLIFGRSEPSAEVRGMAVPPEDPRRYADLRRILATPVGAGSNLAIASHAYPFFGVAGPPYLAEGELAVVRPKAGDFEIIARVRPEDWAALVAAAAER